MLLQKTNYFRRRFWSRLLESMEFLLLQGKTLLQGQRNCLKRQKTDDLPCRNKLEKMLGGGKSETGRLTRKCVRKKGEMKFHMNTVRFFWNLYFWINVNKRKHIVCVFNQILNPLELISCIFSFSAYNGEEIYKRNVTDCVLRRAIQSFTFYFIFIISSSCRVLQHQETSNNSPNKRFFLKKFYFIFYLFFSK